MKATPAQQKHWERGQQIADELERTIQIVTARLNHPVTRQLSIHIVELRDFLADSHLPGENKDKPIEEGG